MALLGAQKDNVVADTENKIADTAKKDVEGTATYLQNALDKWKRSDQVSGSNDVEAVRHERYGEGTIHENSFTKSLTESEAINANQVIKNMKADEQKAIFAKVESIVNAELGRSKKKLTDEQTRKVQHDIIVNYINAGMEGLDTIVKGRLGAIGAGK